MNTGSSIQALRRCMFSLATGVVAWSSSHAPAAFAGGGLILDPPHDFRGFLGSEEGTAINSARTADDFFFFLTNLTSIEVEMIVSFPNAPKAFRVDVFEDSNGEPGDLVLSFDNPVVTDLGEWNGRENYRHLALFFDTEAVPLLKGVYWLSPFGLGNGSGTDRAFWGTSNFGDPNGSEGLFLSDELGFPNWTGVSHPDLLGSPSDFAMQIEGTLPAPGALGVIGLGLVLRRTRRRR